MSLHYLAGRSYYSLGESLLSPSDIVEIAKEKGYESVALTDTMNINGMVEFFEKAKELEIKPILGCRLRIVHDLAYREPKKNELRKSEFCPTYYLKVFVKNEDGYKELLKLLTIANDKDHFYFKPRLSLDDLLPFLKNNNLIVSTGDTLSLLSVATKKDFHYQTIEKILSACSERSQCVLELVAIDQTIYRKCNDLANEISVRHRDIYKIATDPAFYRSEDDADTLDVLSTLIDIRGTKMSSPWRNIPWYRSYKIPEADRFLSWSTNEVVDDCNFIWEKQPVTLPNMSFTQTPFQELVYWVKKGWAERFTKSILGYKPTDLKPYKERLKYELEVLRKMGFENYFLLVRTITSWAKHSGISCGPGRGSVGGSLVAYLLGITDVDPIRFNLLFERFINPDRIDLPDADLDFASSSREDIITFIRNVFGDDRVSGIANYVGLGTASALREVGRLFEIPNDDLEATKYVKKEHGKAFSLEEQLELVPEIAKFKDKYPDIWKHAVKLEGVIRNMGKHAAGVVVAGEPLINRSVLDSRTGQPMINWDKDTAEKMGLVKLDVLGLSTLDVHTEIKKYIKERHGVDVDLTSISLDDPKVLEAFGKGSTTGVFQFSSSGMKNLLRNMALSGRLTFDDLSAATALFRPGPIDSGMMDTYLEVRQGTKIPTYEHPKMEKILEKTNGVAVYQENVMELAREIAGFTPGEADMLRKYMGKKRKEDMAKQREKWIDGCKNHSGLSEVIAGSLFDKIETFASYGFCQAHSYAYTIVSYQSMWLKVYYPAEFYAGSMTVEDKELELELLTEDARKNGFIVHPPDVNKSSSRFEIDGNTLYVPFTKLKGFSQSSSDKIVEARNPTSGPIKFVSKEHFESLVNKTKVNKRHREVLDKVGAFASYKSLTGSCLPALHPDRLRDQRELLPGISMGDVKADRIIIIEPFVESELTKIVHDCESCKKCDLHEQKHPLLYAGKKPKFMVVFDSPTWSDEQEGRMFQGKASEVVRKAMRKVGLKPGDGYYTTLVKGYKPKTQKSLTNAQIGACSEFLSREVELLKPPVIVCMGSNVNRHFVPDAKGGLDELAGKVIYLPKLDTSVVLGINPGMTAFKADANEWLDRIWERVADLVL